MFLELILDKRSKASIQSDPGTESKTFARRRKRSAADALGRDTQWLLRRSCQVLLVRDVVAEEAKVAAVAAGGEEQQWDDNGGDSGSTRRILNRTVRV